MKAQRSRVWGWACPIEGESDEEFEALSYRTWFWLYKHNQIVRHWVGLHQKPRRYSIAPRCDWCGKRKS